MAVHPDTIDTTEWPRETLRRFRAIAADALPFPHFYGSPVFPSAMYERLLAMLPSREEMPADKRATNPYGTHRLSLSVNPENVRAMAPERQRFWAALHALLCGPAFIEAAIDKYRPFVLDRYGDVPKLRARLQIFCDRENYQIRPHTDAPHKAFTLLFYLPRDGSEAHLGTSIYAPKDPSLRSEEATQFPREDFDIHRTFDFAPNSVFGFMKTDRSFHGREPVTGAQTRRYLLNLAFVLAGDAD